ncbi:MAG: hypothetical protein ACM3XM_13150 [Mycobacterium leprae]
MAKFPIILVVAGVVIATGVVGYGLSSMANSGKKLVSTEVVAPVGTGAQLSDAGGVQVQVAFDPKSVTAGGISFKVGLNTHSVELSQFNLAKLARVTLEPGGVLTDLTWTPDGTGGGHHVTGTLIVKDPERKLAGARSVIVEITGVADASVRRFQWAMQEWKENSL